MSDAAQRALALTPNESFIVQAPAGSGKTELLIQRLLVLLAEAGHPSEILAITFTRKAAGEMRERLMSAIRSAAAPMPETSPAKERWQLARLVAERDSAQAWHILERPEQLQIDTFDAFARRIAALGSLTSGSAVLATPLENAQPLYEEAARMALANEDIQAEVRQLLSAVDNRVDLLVRLLSELLANRAQWLSHVVDDSPEALWALRQSLIAAIEIEIEPLAASWTEAVHLQCVRLALYAAHHLAFDGKQDKHDALLVLTKKEMPTHGIEGLAYWRALRDFLLTEDGTWRKSVSKSIGFPAKSDKGISKEEAAERDAMKDAFKEFLHALEASNPDRFCAALLIGGDLPDVDAIAAHEIILKATLTMLKHATAELMLILRTRASTDFSGVALAARAVLTNSRDVVLNQLDARINHILIDEFQDTNPSQAEMISLLTEDWSEGDGRTLFLVGDPMQSIYGFRDSDVGIFLDAWRNEDGGGFAIPLTPIVLTANYRSRPQLIEWVNSTMSRPFNDSGGAGVVKIPFAPATAMRTSSAASINADRPVQLYAFANAEEEADAILADIAGLQTVSPSTHIAIIVRSKRAGLPIIRRLRGAMISFNAQEFVAWDDRPWIRDLMSLTYIIAQPTDTLSWFAWLRSPMVGLTLESLSVIAHLKNTQKISMMEVLTLEACRESLSDEDWGRIARGLQVIDQISQLASSAGLSERVHATWRICGGDELLSSDEERAEIDDYFSLLDAISIGGFMPPRSEFEAEIARTKQSYQLQNLTRESSPSIDVLTIHKAKGLEWDAVYLPGIDAAPRPDTPPLIAWQLVRGGLEHQGKKNRNGRKLLIAARETRKAANGRVLNFVQSQKARETLEEGKRLLYVAVTRAREHMFISGCRTKPDAKVSGRSLGAYLSLPSSQLAPLTSSAFRASGEAAEMETSGEGAPSPSQNVMNATLTRAQWLDVLKLEAHSLPQKLPQNSLNTEVAPNRLTAVSAPVFNQENQAADMARAFGIVGHALLDGLARSRAAKQLFTPNENSVAEALVVEGVDAERATSIAQELLQVLARVSAGKHADFLFPTQHEGSAGNSLTEASMLQKTANHQNAMRLKRVDRSFIDEQNRRWIVDYKFSAPADGEPLNTWLVNEHEKYAPQLDEYAQLFCLLEPTRVVVTALYFPVLDLLSVDKDVTGHSVRN